MAFLNSLNLDQVLKTTSSPQFASLALTGTLTVDTINEKTTDNGIVIDNVTLKDGNIGLTAASHSIGAALGANTLTLGQATSTIYIPGNLTVDGDTIAGDIVQHVDKNIELGKDGTTAALTGAGLSLLGDSNAIVGYFQSGASDNSVLELKAPGAAGVLTLDINATKTLTIAGALNIEADSAINQDVTTDASPTYAGLTLSGLNTANGIVQTDGSGVLSTSTALPNNTTATTQTSGDNSTKVATTAYVDGQIYAVVDVTDTTQAMSATQNTLYRANNAAEVTFTLPASVSRDKKWLIVGVGAGGFKVAQNAGQTIHSSGGDTTTGVSGYASAAQYGVLELMCSTADTDFIVIGGAATPA